jgi:hypothetical protein
MQKNKLYTLCALLCISTTFALAEIEQVKVSLDKVELHLQKKDWSSAVNELRQVSPADRGTKWESLVETASVGYLKARVKESPGGIDPLVESLYQSFPVLLRSKLFSAEKTAIILNGFEECYKIEKEKQECTSRLLGAIEKNKKDTDFCYKAIYLVATNGTAYETLSAFKAAVTDPSISKLCIHPSVQLGAASGLASADTKTVELAKEITDNYCWIYFKEAVVKTLGSKPSKTFLKNACGILIKKKEFVAEQKKYCQ